jgi:hypothetical protein
MFISGIGFELRIVKNREEVNEMARKDMRTTQSQWLGLRDGESSQTRRVSYHSSYHDGSKALWPVGCEY